MTEAQARKLDALESEGFDYATQVESDGSILVVGPHEPGTWCGHVTPDGDYIATERF